MTPTELLKLETLSKDEELMTGLHKVFDETIAETAKLVTVGLSNEQIGANFRAREEAKRLVDAAFGRLAQFTQVAKTYKPNPAR